MKENETRTQRVARWAPETLPVRVVLWIAFIAFSLLLIGLVARGVIAGISEETAGPRPRSFQGNP
jgi:hypothetical protein